MYKNFKCTDNVKTQLNRPYKHITLAAERGQSILEPEMKIKTGMSPSVAFFMCAALFISFCSCESFSKRDEVELEGAPKIAGIEETDVDWNEDENVEDNSDHPDNDATEYGMEQDGMYVR